MAAKTQAIAAAIIFFVFPVHSLELELQIPTTDVP